MAQVTDVLPYWVQHQKGGPEAGKAVLYARGARRPPKVSACGCGPQSLSWSHSSGLRGVTGGGPWGGHPHLGDSWWQPGFAFTFPPTPAGLLSAGRDSASSLWPWGRRGLAGMWGFWGMWLLVTGVLEVPGGVTAPVSMQTFKTHFVIF